MSAKSGLRMHVTALALLAVLLAGVPRAGAGQCIGADRARVVRLFEYLFFLLNDKLTACEFHASDFLTKLRGSTLRLTPILSMGMIRLESRWTMRRLLIGEDFSTAKMTDALQAHANRVQLILSYIQESEKVPPGKLRRIAAMTAGTFMVCRAVRQKSPEACAALDPPDRGGLRSECESLAVSVGILYQNDCSDEAVGKIASVWHRQAETVRKYCRAIKEKQPHQCAAIPDTSPLEQAACRAQAGHGETACQDPVFSKDTSRECQNELRIQEVLAGSIPPAAIPKELKEQELVWPALLAARGDIPCDELAIDAYEEMIAPLELFTHTF